MKNAALSGKPYAGNSHVRFDEGEVASEKPRRGSLLYKTKTRVTFRDDGNTGMTSQKRLAPIVTIVGCILTMAFHVGATPSRASLINELPEPSADGWYEVGNGSFSSALFNSQGMAGIGYVDWAALRTAGLPANAKIRLVGGVALHQVPVDVTLDYSKATHIAFLDRSAYSGSTFTVPSGLDVIYAPVKSVSKASEVAGAEVVLTLDANSRKVECPIVNNGTWNFGKDGAASAIFDKGLTGLGANTICGMNVALMITGLLDFKGKINFSDKQEGQGVYISSDQEAKLGVLTAGNPSGIGKASQGLVYTPARDPSDTPCTLTIDNYVANKNGGYDNSGEAANFHRYGGQFCVCAGNTIKIKSISNVAAVGLIASDDFKYKNGAYPTFNQGFGNFEIGGGDKKMNGSKTFYASPNLNIKFVGKNLETLNDMITVNYTAEDNVVNRGTLDFSQMTKTGDDGQYWPKSTVIIAISPWNLPRSITVPNDIREKTTVKVGSDRWVMPFDFGAEVEEVNVARCETNCRLEIPETGVVVVSNTTAETETSFPARKTLFPILTCTSGGEEAFAGWTVEKAGGWDANDVVEKVVTDKGMYVKIYRRKGLALIFR